MGEVTCIWPYKILQQKSRDGGPECGLDASEACQ